METTELTIVERVNELATASGKAIEFEVQELTKLSDRAKSIDSIDHKDFKEVKGEMVKKRNYIKQYCLDARRDIKKVAEGVSDVENMLYSLFVPEENRLAEIAEEARQKEIRVEREQKLPWRKEKLAELDSVMEDEDILALDDKAFQIVLNEKTQEKLERLEAEKRAVEAEERKQEEIADAIEKTKKEAEEKAKHDAEELERKHQEELDRIEREAKEKIENDQREKVRVEALKIAEQKKLEGKEKYQNFLKEIGMTKENIEEFHKIETETEVIVYKKVGVFKK